MPATESPFARWAKKPEMDDRDRLLFEQRHAFYLSLTEPTVGDYVRFRDGTVRRISHVWWDASVQTSDHGSFYLGSGYVEFSGGLFSSVPGKTLTLTEERKPGSFWFFRHDRYERHNGVYFQADCRVWECSEEAPSS